MSAVELSHLVLGQLAALLVLALACVGLGVRLIVSAPLPVPKVFAQPRPCRSSGAASGSGPT